MSMDYLTVGGVKAKIDPLECSFYSIVPYSVPREPIKRGRWGPLGYLLGFGEPYRTVWVQAPPSTEGGASS